MAFTADARMIKAAEACISELNLNAIRGLVVSGDTFVNGAERLVRIHAIFPQAIAVEMEAAAIGHVCYKFKVPFLVIRTISDVADKKSHLSFGEFLGITAQQSSLIVEKLLERLEHG